jgi:hypothetical protein
MAIYPPACINYNIGAIYPILASVLCHSYINHQRSINISSPSEYIKLINNSNTNGLNESFSNSCHLTNFPSDTDEEIGTMMMGL